MKKDFLELLLDSLIEEMATGIDEQGQGRRSKLTFDAALAAAKDPATDTKTVDGLYNDFKASTEIARAVARHPNAGSHTLSVLYVFLPDDVVSNPSYERISEERNWDRNHDYRVRGGRRGKANARDAYSISETSPELYRIPFYLDNAGPADFRYIAGIEKVPNKLLRPYLTSKNSHLRKALAGRQYFEASDYESLATDSAKSVRLVLAANPGVPGPIVEILATDKDDEVRSAAVANPNCPPEVSHTVKMTEAAKPTLMDKAVSNLSMDDVRVVLGDPATTAERLDELANSDEAYVRYACGMHGNASEKLLKALLKDKPQWLAEAVAYNPSAPPELLETLVGKATAGVKMGLAWNPATPEAAQLELAESGTDKQRYVLANTTEHLSVWEKLAENGDIKRKKADAGWEDHLAVALNPKTPSSKLNGLQRACDSRHQFVGRLTARHPNCPDALASQLAYYCYSELAHNPKFALQILENPNAIKGAPVKTWLLSEWFSYDDVPGHIVNYYLVSDDETNRRRAVSSRRASLRLLQPMVFDPDTKLRSALAARKDLTRFMLEVLARDKNNRTRELIAKQSNCPVELLALLASDKTAAVRAAAIQNSKYEADPKTADKTAKKEQYRDRGPKKDRLKIAEEARSASVLADLAQDKDADVRRVVADNDHTKAGPLVKLGRDADADVRRTVAYHEATPLETRQQLLDDADVRVRRAAFNSATYILKDTALEDVIKQAAGDSDIDIRGIAAESTRDLKMQEAFADEGEQKILRKLSGNPHLVTALGKRLMKSEDKAVRTNIARTIADLDVIEEALNDDEDDVRWGVTGNPLFHKNAIRFVHHPNIDVRSSLAIYVNEIPAAAFDELAKDPTERVQRYLADAKNMSRKRVELLLDTGSAAALWRLSNRELLTEADAQRCADHHDPEVRCIPASTYPLSDETFERLLKDESEEVRELLPNNKRLKKAQRARARAVKQG